MKLNLTRTDIFHVHTCRCEHAGTDPDEAYAKRAVELGARSIWFTDHAPFPGDPFFARMHYADLEEYLLSLTALKEKYRKDIEVHIGLETEYFPSFDQSGYYRKLKDDPRIEVLLLGQHMAETGKDEYSFSWSKKRLTAEEHRALGEAYIGGIRSGYFDAVAHPDRIFRRRIKWDPDMQEIAERLVEAAAEAYAPLEINMSSMAYGGMFWPEFWELVPKGHPVLVGVDAHSVYEMERFFYDAWGKFETLKDGEGIEYKPADQPVNRLFFYEPEYEDLWFRQMMLADEETMSYNHAWGGTIAWPEEEWSGWYDYWIINHEGKRFYRYLKDKDGQFIGEVAYHYDVDLQHEMADVIIYSKHRGKGYGGEALEMLCLAAKENGVSVLYDDIAIDNPAIGLFLDHGFSEEYRTEEKIMLKREL